ncbi:MAG TPA: FG-GAP-like repeat-containing protein, partial [Pyrinomonadaceae bacterium]
MYTIKRILIVTQLIVLILAAAFSAQAAGEVDPTFNGAAYGDLTSQESVYVVKLQPDGKILLGGQFTEVQGFAASGLARLNADGTVDTNFNAPDFYTFNSNTGGTALGGNIYAIAVQPDGKILVGGSMRNVNGDARQGVRRLNADGSLDSSFFIQQMSLGASSVQAIKLQADGKILIGGAFTISGTSAKNLARLNPDGTLDTSFADSTSNATITDLEIQPDGKIVAGGYAGASMPGVFRYNPDGTTDSSFLSTQSVNSGVEAVELQADGKIIVAGSYTTLNGVNQGRVSRLNANGTLDSNFNPGGVGADAVVNDIAIRPDGKIIIGGDFASFNSTPMRRIARLNTDGTLDNTFSNVGTVSNTVVNDVELLPDDRILAGLNSSTLVESLLRFSANGSVDLDFVVKVTKGGTIYAILQQPDGKILVAGEFLYASGGQRRSLARLNPDGSLDTSFVPYFNNLSPQIIYAIALQPDGKILVGAWHGIVFQRLNADGSQDAGFNPGLPSSSIVYSIAMQADGKILVGGLMMPVLPTFARYNSNGTRDAAFNPAQPNWYVRKVFIQPDGKFLVGGAFSAISDIAIRNGIARYNADGVLDNTFNPPGGATVNVGDIDLQANGKVVHAGSTGVTRLNSNGTFDASVSGINSEVSAVKILPDGKILFGGGFSLVGATARNGIARLNANFTLDASFTTYANRNVNDIELQTDGKILLGGAFGKINGASGTRVARLLNVSVPNSTLFDYDGDGRADISVFRASENRWYVFRSSDSVVAQQIFAISGDVPVPADYDGDRKTDYAIYRPSSGDWWYLSSINNAQVFVDWGQAGDIPMPSDFDGDGRSDFVLYRPSNSMWYRISNGVSGTVSNIQFGLPGDKPVRGDFDGDGKSDAAIFRPSTGDWWWQSSNDNIQRATHWGISTDVPAPGDFDGDGKTDFAVYRPSNGTWYIYNSATLSSTIVNFGIAEDKPVAADYDG